MEELNPDGEGKRLEGRRSDDGLRGKFFSGMTELSGASADLRLSPSLHRHLPFSNIRPDFILRSVFAGSCHCYPSLVSLRLSMAQIPTPPTSRPGSETPDPELKEAPVSDSSADLLHSLDALLERYLDLLDQHQKSHAELARRISSV